MSSPDIDESDVEAVLGVLRSTSLSIGPRVQDFEASVARFVGMRHAAAVSSGTAGLHLALIAADVDENDVVITTPFSFVASANAVLYQRAIPAFVDVNPRTGNIDPAQVSEALADLESGGSRAMQWLPPGVDRARIGRVRAVLPVHAFGQPADMDALCAAARRHDVRVIEDACEALGSEYRGRPAGSAGDAAVFAFYPNKQITTGEGGVIVTDHTGWDTLFRSLRNQGRDVFDAWLSHSRLGFNYRLDEMSAALGNSQLRRIGEFLAHRARVAGWYGEMLAGIEGIQTPEVDDTTTRMSWFVYVARLESRSSRDRLLAELEAVGIPSRVYFNPIHRQPFYQERLGYRRGHFPVTERLGDTCLALPFSSVMTRAQVERVCAAVAGILTRVPV